MLFRRAVFVAMFPAAVILPLWVLISRGIAADEIGWAFVAYLFACPVLFVLLAAISGIVTARKSTRDARAVSRWDAAVLVTLWVAVVASGIFAVALLAAAVVVLVVGMFWLAVWEFVTEARTRVTTFMTGIEAQSRQSSYIPPAQGETIVIKTGE